MSDALITIIAVGVIAALQSLLKAWTDRKASAQNAEIIAEAKILNKKLEENNQKVDEYHKETNSKLSQLVVAEKGLSFAEGEKQGRADQIISDKGNQPIVDYDTDKPSEESKGGTGTGVKKNLDQAKDKIDQAKKKLDEI